MKNLKKSGDDDGGEAWISSFADMMCLLLGFFMILYSLSFIDDRQFYTMGKSIASTFSKGSNKKASSPTSEPREQNESKAFRILASIMNLGDPGQAAANIRKAYDKAKTYEEAEIVIKDQMEKNGVDAEKLREKYVRSNQIEYFEFNIPLQIGELTTENRLVLDAIGKYIIDEGDTFEIDIIGNAAEKKASSKIAGLQQGVRLASKTAEYLINRGVPIDQIKISSKGQSNRAKLKDDGKKNPRKQKIDDDRIQILIKRI